MEKIYQHPNIKIPVQGKWYLTETKGSHGYMLQSSEHALWSSLFNELEIFGLKNNLTEIQQSSPA